MKDRRLFSREFKLAALARLEAAGNVVGVARELGIRRELLYKWQAKFAAGGAEALRTSGRPRPTGAGLSPEALDGADRIAELERKVGQQAFELDFFKGALRLIEASRRPSDGPGVTASSRRSKR
jgi:transposase-like protein